MVLIHSGTYQGRPVQKCSYRRSQGLRAEPGFVEMAIEDVKSLLITSRPVPWRGVAGTEIPDGTTISAYIRSGGTTISTPSPFPTPGEGFDIAGDLILSTEDSGGGTRTIKYNDVYLSADGVQEVTLDRDEARKHATGDVRVAITDIRKWWPDHGTLSHSINIRKRRGKAYEPDTIKLDSQGNPLDPFSAEEVFRFLFALMPGNPPVIWKVAGKVDPPSDILADGEPAFDILTRLLAKYGLECYLLKNNRVMVAPATAQSVPAQQISLGEPGTYGDPAALLADELKSSSLTHRSPVVTVYGRRRVRRITVPMVPIFQDVDGRFYRLEDIGTVWEGYSLGHVNRMVFASDEKAWRDVPPCPPDLDVDGNSERGSGLGGSAPFLPEDAKLHAQRRAIMRRWAYRGYAPASMFSPETDLASGDIVPSFIDEDVDGVKYLPMLEAPLYLGDAKARGLAIPSDDRPAKGDADDIVMVPPILYASASGRGLYRDWSAIKDHFMSKMPAALTVDLQVIADQRDKALQRLSNSADIAEAALKAAPVYSPGDMSSADAETGIVALDSDALLAFSMVGTILDPRLKDLKFIDGSTHSRLQVTKAYANDVVKYDKMLANLNERLAEWTSKINELDLVYSTVGAISVERINLPRRLMPEGSASIDRRTGIAMFGEPLAQIVEPFVVDGDTATVANDGMLTMTFGYESRTHSVTDLTSVSCISDTPTNPEAGKVAVCAVCRPPAVKARVMSSPTMRLYEEDLGTPMNLKEVMADAVKIAGGHLRQPIGHNGFIYHMDGFVDATLDVGVSSVQHVWDGDTAETVVAINSPGALMPLGLPKMAHAPESQQAEAVEIARRVVSSGLND